MTDDPRFELLLAIADDEFILGHRLSEWTGWVPYLEEDLALSSIAQDEMGHARTLYQMAIDEGWATDEDALALGRPPEAYRHAVLCERPNRDFAYTLARHWLYDMADDVRTTALRASSWKPLTAALEIAALEERYHLMHARTWFARLADGPLDARKRFAHALADALSDALALFEPLPSEGALIADGVLPASSETLRTRWLDAIGPDLDGVGFEEVLAGTHGELVPTSSGAIEQKAGNALSVPGLSRRGGRWVHDGPFPSAGDGSGGRYGQRSEDWLSLWTEMTALYRSIPGARW